MTVQDVVKVNGVFYPCDRDLTEEEIGAMEQAGQKSEEGFWHLPYGERVSALIREKYSMDDEFAIQRQRAEKPEEFLAYFNFCEACKTKAREKPDTASNA